MLVMVMRNRKDGEGWMRMREMEDGGDNLDLGGW